ncbi:MAG: hypothetical protein WCG06_00920, partial [Candidatus Omnitrophota bacterium]
MSDGDPHVVPGISPHPNTSFYAKLQPALSILILLICGLGMLSLSWLKWPDALVDFGHELYIPWQLSAGGVLYKDIAHLSGPLSPYFNALLFRLFGAGLMTLVGFNLLLIAALAGILYRLFLRTADRLTATAVCAAFLTVFAFSQYIKTGNYNFVCPYSHHLTHGVFLAFLAIYLFMGYVER